MFYCRIRMFFLFRVILASASHRLARLNLRKTKRFEIVHVELHTSYVTIYGEVNSVKNTTINI